MSLFHNANVDTTHYPSVNTDMAKWNQKLRDAENQLSTHITALHRAINMPPSSNMTPNVKIIKVDNAIRKLLMVIDSKNDMVSKASVDVHMEKINAIQIIFDVHSMEEAKLDKALDEEINEKNERHNNRMLKNEEELMELEQLLIKKSGLARQAMMEKDDFVKDYKEQQRNLVVSHQSIVKKKKKHKKNRMNGWVDRDRKFENQIELENECLG